MLETIFQDPIQRVLVQYSSRLKQINLIGTELKKLTDLELREKTTILKQRLPNATDNEKESIINEAFALVREASDRVLGLRHFDVQIVGGLVLNEGKIAEMKTGEGKTLVATLPAYLNALTNKGVHIVTVNDYLAKRDSKWMGQVFEKLGLTTSAISNDINDDERQHTYSCDVT